MGKRKYHSPRWLESDHVEQRELAAQYIDLFLLYDLVMVPSLTSVFYLGLDGYEGPTYADDQDHLSLSCALYDRAALLRRSRGALLLRRMFWHASAEPLYYNSSELTGYWRLHVNRIVNNMCVVPQPDDSVRLDSFDIGPLALETNRRNPI